MHDTPAVVGRSQAGFEPDCRCKVCDGGFEIALETVKHAPKVISRSIAVGIDSDRFGVIGDGTVVFALALPNMGPLVVCKGRFRIQPDRLAVVSNGTVDVILRL